MEFEFGCVVVMVISFTLMAMSLATVSSEQSETEQIDADDIPASIRNEWRWTRGVSGWSADSPRFLGSYYEIHLFPDGMHRAYRCGAIDDLEIGEYRSLEEAQHACKAWEQLR